MHCQITTCLLTEACVMLVKAQHAVLVVMDPLLPPLCTCVCVCVRDNHTNHSNLRSLLNEQQMAPELQE